MNHSRSRAIKLESIFKEELHKYMLELYKSTSRSHRALAAQFGDFNWGYAMTLLKHYLKKC